MVRTRRKPLILGATVGGGALALAVAVASSAAAQQADPPGNNGTVKIDAVEFDDHPNNEPHVGCMFQVDFYGFDQGDLQATVTFETLPPTGKDELLTDEVFIGEDPASGGTDLDASATYDLSDELAGIEPHPQQGWHVRLTVNAEGSQGADTKHKVFWVTGCGPTTSTSTTATTTPGSATTIPGSSVTPGMAPPAAPVPAEPNFTG
jgi:hypothetical protein